jgi:DNA-binding MarR family transcriptional regulator
MSLEQDIQQKSFRDEYQKAFLNVLVTANDLTTKLNEFFKGYGITRQQYNVLRILRGQHPKPATVFTIRDRMLDKMSDASRIVERLRVKELVHREDSDIDKRTVHVTITMGGLELLKSIDPKITELEKPFHAISVEEVTLLNKMLEKVRED